MVSAGIESRLCSFFSSVTASGTSRAFIVSIAFLTAIPFRSLPDEAAVGEVLGTLEVLVAFTFTDSGLMPSSAAAICCILV